MQEITDLLSDKTIKPNEKRETLSSWISEKKVDALEVINFAKSQKMQSKQPALKRLNL